MRLYYMDQLCMKINTDIHGSLVGKQNLKIHNRHPMLRKIRVVIKKKNGAPCNYFS